MNIAEEIIITGSVLTALGVIVAAAVKVLSNTESEVEENG